MAGEWEPAPADWIKGESEMALRNVTVFGGSGFLGRYLVKRLADGGVRVRVAVRDPEAANFLQPMGRVGQVIPLQTNIRDLDSVKRAVEGADAVVNAVGILYETGRQRFDAVHVDGAGAVAEAAREAGATRLLHVSALAADAGSTAHYARSKAAGEAAVRGAFGAAAIVRPSVIFGPEDNFFNRFGKMLPLTPVLPLFGGGETRFQPVYVGDVARAMQRILEAETNPGQTHELGGPRIYSFRQLMELVMAVTGRRRLLVPVPFALAKFDAWFLQLLPNPLLTVDQVELLKSDNIVGEGVTGFEAFEIQPSPAESVLPSYMARYRRGGKLTPRNLAQP